MKKAMVFALLLAMLSMMMLVQAEGAARMNSEIVEIAAAYTAQAEHPGEVVRFDYKTSAEDKYAYVYLPYGSSDQQQYDILYVMHGGGGSQGSLFGGAGQSNDIKNASDHLIENGEMKPMIIVTPTFYTERHSSMGVSGSWDAVREFPDELVNDLMPAVESAYSTYAETADSAGFAASREHRAFGGFSMGSVTTWYVFERYLAYFQDFIPISGDSWTIEMQGGNGNAEETARALAEAVERQGNPSFFIFAITGSDDIAEPMMTPQVAAMRQLNAFHFTDTGREDGNLTYQVKDGGTHAMPEVKMYLYNILPRLWPAE